MIKRKTLVIAIITAMLLAAIPAGAFAAAVVTDYDFAQAASSVSYSGITGKITGITPGDESESGITSVRIEQAEGGEAVFYITADTYCFDSVELSIDEVVNFFYESSPSIPMTLQYPPTYQAVVLAPVTDEYSVFVGLFNDNLLSSDNKLRLIGTDAAEIVSTDGQPYSGELANNVLAVCYKITTMSLPPQTPPIKIIVLDTKPLANNTPPMDLSVIPSLTISLNGQPIDAPNAYSNEAGVVMLPLRAIAAAMGFQVNWDADLRTCMLGISITVYADKDEYIYARMAPIQLGVKPEINEDGRLFVPISFFTEVARCESATVTESGIIIIFAP